MHNDKLGSTHEAFVGVPASLGDRTGNFAVFLYLEVDACITSGREIWGWPKKEARFRYEAGEDGVQATVERGGAELIRAAFEPAVPAEAAALALDPTWFNLKLIPSVEEGAPPDVMQLTATTFRDFVVHEAHAGTATLRLGSTPEDPLGQLIEVRETLPAAYVRFDLDLLHGEVIHDYRPAVRVAHDRQLAAAR
jgi:acetoacetate decarboxylase